MSCPKYSFYLSVLILLYLINLYIIHYTFDWKHRQVATNLSRGCMRNQYFFSCFQIWNLDAQIFIYYVFFFSFMNHYAWRSKNTHVQQYKETKTNLSLKNTKRTKLLIPRNANMSTLPLAVNATILYRRSGDVRTFHPGVW